MIRGSGNKANPSKRHVPPEKRGDSGTVVEGQREGTEKLDYIRQMLLELRQIADETGEGTLVYMIEMAMMEAEECKNLRERAAGMDR